MAPEQATHMSLKRIFLLLFLFLLVSCQTAPGQPSTTGGSSGTSGPLRRKITIAWIPKGLNNPVFETGRLGAIQKAAELSAVVPLMWKCSTLLLWIPMALNKPAWWMMLWRAGLTALQSRVTILPPASIRSIVQ